MSEETVTNYTTTAHPQLEELLFTGENDATLKEGSIDSQQEELLPEGGVLTTSSIKSLVVHVTCAHVRQRAGGGGNGGEGEKGASEKRSPHVGLGEQLFVDVDKLFLQRHLAPLT